MRTAAGPPEAVLDHIAVGTDLIVPVANGEPPALLDAIEADAGGLQDVRVHQMLPLRPRPHHVGSIPGVRHVSYFLSETLREPYAAGLVDLVPNDFHALPGILRRSTDDPLLLIAVSPPDRNGMVSMGVAADYVAPLLGESRVFAQVAPQMPRTFGRHTMHLDDAVGWCEADTPLIEFPTAATTDVDRAIGAFVAERIPDGAVLQVGVGSVPDAVAALLVDKKDLGIHSELFGDGLRALVESGAAAGGAKVSERGKAVTTTVLGTNELYSFVDDNTMIEMWPVDLTNDPRVIARHPGFVAVNATMQVDLMGQCASESLGLHYVSSTGGQSDYMRGAMLSQGGQNFMVTHSTAHAADGSLVSRIVATLAPGAVVTTDKNVIDKVVTEFGVAQLHGATAAQRAKRLIAIAHPDFRDELERAAKEDGILH